MATRQAKSRVDTSDADHDDAARPADAAVKLSNLQRLTRIEGQVRGIQRMVQDDRYCADILMQISSVQEALRAVGKAIMRNHLTHCATHAIRDGSPDERNAMYEELLDLIYKNAR